MSAAPERSGQSADRQRHVVGDKGMLTQCFASDDKGIVKMDFLVDGKLAVQSRGTCTMTYDSIMEDDGLHTLVAKATDTTGQYTNATVPFTIANGQLIKMAASKKATAWAGPTPRRRLARFAANA